MTVGTAGLCNAEALHVRGPVGPARSTAAGTVRLVSLGICVCAGLAPKITALTNDLLGCFNQERIAQQPGTGPMASRTFAQASSSRLPCCGTRVPAERVLALPGQSSTVLKAG